MSSSEQEHDTFVIERDYAQSPERVWAAWSQLDRKRTWMGDGLESFDFRVGGEERSRFENEMGEHVNETRYFDIKQYERIVHAYSMALNGVVHTVSLVTIAFEARGDGTRLTYTEQMCVIPPSDGVEGRRHGWTVLLGALEESLAN